MGAVAAVERRCRARRAGSLGEGFTNALDAVHDLPGQLRAVSLEQVPEHAQRCAQLLALQFAFQFLARRGAPRAPGRGLAGNEVGRGRGENGCGVHARHAVDHAVVQFRDQREALAVQALDDPRLPQRSRTIERLRGDAPGERLELRVAARAGKRRVPHVVVDVEVRVVHPYRRQRFVLVRAVAETQVAAQFAVRAPHELLAVARYLLDRDGGRVPDGREVDAAARAAQRAGLENRHAGHAHVPLGRFLRQEGIVDESEGFEVVVVHGATPQAVVVCTTLPHPGREVNALAPARNKLTLKRIRGNC